LLGLPKKVHSIAATITAKLDGLDAKMTMANKVVDFVPKLIVKPVTVQSTAV
jgi:hypothetical protein